MIKEVVENYVLSMVDMFVGGELVVNVVNIDDCLFVIDCLEFFIINLLFSNGFVVNIIVLVECKLDNWCVYVLVCLMIIILFIIVVILLSWG